MRFPVPQKPKKETILLRSVRGTEDYLTIRHANPYTGLVTPSPLVMTPIEGLARTPRTPAEAIQLYSPVTKIDSNDQDAIVRVDGKDETNSFFMVVKRAARALSASNGSGPVPVNAGAVAAALAAVEKTTDTAGDTSVVEADVFPCRPVLRRGHPVFGVQRGEQRPQGPRLRAGGDSGRITEILDTKSDFNSTSSGTTNISPRTARGMHIPRVPSRVLEADEESQTPSPTAKAAISDKKGLDIPPIPPIPPRMAGDLGRKPSKYTLDHVAAYWSWVRRSRDTEDSDGKNEEQATAIENSPGIRAAKGARRVSGGSERAPPRLQTTTKPFQSVESVTSSQDEQSPVSPVEEAVVKTTKTDQLQCMNVPKVFKEDKWMKSRDWLHLPQVVLVHPSEASHPRSASGGSVQRASTEGLIMSNISPISVPESLRVLGFVGEGLIDLVGRIPCYGIDERMMATFRALANPEAPPRLRLEGLKNAFFVLGQALVAVYVVMCFVRILTVLMEGLKIVFLPVRLVIKILGWIFKV